MAVEPSRSAALSFQDFLDTRRERSLSQMCAYQISVLAPHRGLGGLVASIPYPSETIIVHSTTEFTVAGTDAAATAWDSRMQPRARVFVSRSPGDGGGLNNARRRDGPARCGPQRLRGEGCPVSSGVLGTVERPVRRLDQL